MAPVVAVVLCTYNRSQMLRATLMDLICQETDGRFSYEIIVVDDGSTDDTYQIVNEVAEVSRVPLKYVREEGKGYTHAMNRGVSESRAESIAFFDDDQRTGCDYLKELFAVALNTGAQLVGASRVLDFSEAEIKMIGPVCRAVCGEFPYSRGRGHKNPLPAGGIILVNRKVFDVVGHFDETFLTGGCDRDFVLRARGAGFIIGLAPKAVVRHVIPSDRIEPDKIRQYSRQVGCSFAHIDWKMSGRWKMVLICILRIGQAFLVNIPALFMAILCGNKPQVLDLKSLLWKAEGYTRKTCSLLIPQLFPQKGFFNQTEFRKQR